MVNGMMTTTFSGREDTDERIVRDYLTALGSGRVLDALNAFSMDASFRDESGTERRGIREIAAAFARREPLRIEIEEVRREGTALVARVRMRASAARRPRLYRSVFRIRQRRIRSLEIEPQLP